MNKYCKILGLGIVAAGTFLLINACSVKVPENISVVKNFDAKAY